MPASAWKGRRHRPSLNGPFWTWPPSPHVHIIILEIEAVGSAGRSLRIGGSHAGVVGASICWPDHKNHVCIGGAGSCHQFGGGVVNLHNLTQPAACRLARIQSYLRVGGQISKTEPITPIAVLDIAKGTCVPFPIVEVKGESICGCEGVVSLRLQLQRSLGPRNSQAIFPGEYVIMLQTNQVGPRHGSNKRCVTYIAVTVAVEVGPLFTVWIVDANEEARTSRIANRLGRNQQPIPDVGGEGPVIQIAGL